MVASIWLQLGGEQNESLRSLIASFATKHGTMPFQPHLTVCALPNATEAIGDAAAEFVASCRLLPLTVRKVGISTSTTVPFRAVIIDVENTPSLRSFREALQRITGASELITPHISLLYTIDAREQRTEWSASEERLRAIAEEAAPRILATELVLDDPVVVTPDGDWTNIKSWKTVRHLRRK